MVTNGFDEEVWFYLWRDAMLASDERGRATIQNFEFDERHSRLNKQVIQDLKKTIAQLWYTTVTNQTNDDPQTIFANARAQNIQKHICAGGPILTPAERFSRVLHVTDLTKYHINLNAVPILDAGGEIDEVQFAILEQTTLGPNDMQDKFIQGKLPCAWVTPTQELADDIDKEIRRRAKRRPFASKYTDDLEPLTRPSNAYARYVRRRLGLSHFVESHYLVEMRYTSGFFRNVDVFGPTFLDGCPSPIYRSVDEPDGYGRAVDLKTYRNALCEAVHKPVKPSSGFSVIRLGRITDNPPLAQHNENKYAAHSPD